MWRVGKRNGQQTHGKGTKTRANPHLGAKEQKKIVMFVHCVAKKKGSRALMQFLIGLVKANAPT